MRRPSRHARGSWALPADEGEHDLSLPLCVAKPSIDTQPMVLGTGITTVTASTWSGTTYTYLQGSQDLEEADGSNWSMVHLMVLVADEGDPPGAIAADGGAPDTETGSGAEFTLVPSGSSDSDPEAITYIPCSVDDWDVFTHTVTFDGGEVTLQLNLGDNVVQTAPGSFSIAEGTLDGTAFSQTDRFKLVYRPGHHHFERDFAVIFDDPIGDACALRIEAIDGVDDGITAEVHTADCELGILEAREVTAETLTEE